MLPAFMLYLLTFSFEIWWVMLFCRDKELENNISTIGELLAKLRERRPRLEPFLDSFFLPSNNPKIQELPKPTVGPSNQGKGNKAKEDNKSRPKKKGNKKKQGHVWHRSHVISNFVLGSGFAEIGLCRVYIL